MVLDALPYALLIRLAVGCWMYSNSSILLGSIDTITLSKSTSSNTIDDFLIQYSNSLQQWRDSAKSQAPSFNYLIDRLSKPFSFPLFGVRTKTVKKSAKVIIEKYYSRLTLDFHTNKRIAQEVAIVPSKRMRNKIAGFVTHLMKRIQKGPVRGISLKLQEEERERRLDYVPERSALEKDIITIDSDTQALLESLNFKELSNVQTA
eukprot:gene17083-22596_t